MSISTWNAHTTICTFPIGIANCRHLTAKHLSQLRVDSYRHYMLKWITQTILTLYAKCECHPILRMIVQARAGCGLQAVSIKMSWSHFILPVAEHHCPMVTTKLYCSAMKVQKCEQFAHSHYMKLERPRVVTLSKQKSATGNKVLATGDMICSHRWQLTTDRWAKEVKSWVRSFLVIRRYWRLWKMTGSRRLPLRV